jgi:uncharacterized protein (TIGR02099 family)
LTSTIKTSRLRYWLRQAAGLLLTTLAVLIILTAVLVGIGRALIPYADHLRPWLAERLSEQVGQEVYIEQLQADWPRLTPQLNLYGLRVGDADEPVLEVDQARLEIHLPDFIGDQRNPVRLIVLGLDLVLAEDEDGQWGLRLEGGAQLADRPARDQMLAGDLLIRHARLKILPRNLPHVSTRLVEGEIRRRGDQTFIQGLLEPLEGDGGDIRIDVLLSHPRDHWERLEAHAVADNLVLDAWVGQNWVSEEARMSLQAWGEWSLDDGARLDLDLDFFDIGPDHELVSSSWLLSRKERRIQLELIHLTTGDHEDDVAAAGVALARDGPAWALMIDELDLDAMHGLLMEPLAWVPFMPSRLSGRVNDLEAGWLAGSGLYLLSGQVDGLDITLPDPLPSVAGLDVELALSGDRVLVRPGGQPVVDWPALLRETVSLEAIGGQVLLSPGSIELRGVEIENAFTHGIADGWIYLGGERPFLDFTIDARRVSQIDPRPFLPPRYIPENAMQWLDDSLHWVEQGEGLVVFHMRAGKAARDIEDGDFQAQIDFSGATIDYWPDWPVASQLEGRAEFVGSSLSGRVDSGRLGNVPVSAPSLLIAELTEPEMIIELEAASVESAEIAELLGSIPEADWEAILDPMRWSGPASISTRLKLPFRSMDDWWIEGQTRLEGSRLLLPAIPIEFRQLSGSVDFDREHIGPAEVTVGNHDDPDLFKITAALARPGWLTVEAETNPARLVPEDSPLSMADAFLSGRSNFRFDMRADEDGGLRQELESSLEGMSVTLPAPLKKDRDEVWPLSVVFRTGPQQGDLKVRLDPLLELRALQAHDGWRIAAGFNQERGELPEEAGIQATGQLDVLALSDWFEIFEAAGGAGDGFELPLKGNIELGRLEVFGLELTNLDVDIERRSSTWIFGLEGENIEGQVSVPIPLDSGRVLVADLSRLYLEPVEPPEDEPEFDLQPLPSQTSGQSPRNRPPLHLFIEDLRWGDLDLGRARLESHAMAEGMEIEYVDVSGPDLRLTGRGRWVESEDRIQSEFHGRLMTGSLSDLLESAGYESGIEASRAQVDAELRWPGAPQDFALRRLSGAFDLQISDGSIPEARPGAGRLLGLASFQAIPRRLMLDFRDVFGAGLKFDRIEGRFDLAAGFARTDGLVIESPAAVITISGDTDMAARRYDQLIVVEPGLGATLPIIGIVAGGPAGAAAGLVLRQILDRPLRGLAEARYSVTGSWDDPKIELIEARVEADDGEEEIIDPRDVDPDDD